MKILPRYILNQKRNNMKKIILMYTVSILFFIECDLNNQKLKLVNNTKHKMYYRLLTDTLLNYDLFLYEISPNDTIWPNFVMGRGERVWEQKINTKSKDSNLYIYIFSTNRLNDGIIRKREYKRIGFKVKDLDKLNWIVSYPKDF
jgi:hypothetical protein